MSGTLEFDWADAWTRTLAERFTRYHAANPQVWEAFDRLARQAVGVGRTRLSAKLFFEVIRWETLVSARGDAFKVNNSFSAFYARL